MINQNNNEEKKECKHGFTECELCEAMNELSSPEVPSWKELKQNILELDEMELATARDRILQEIDSLLSSAEQKARQEGYKKGYIDATIISKKNLERLRERSHNGVDIYNDILDLIDE